MAKIELTGLTKEFRAPSGTGRIRAVDGVDLAISSGESVALVGESGSGKSTIARMLVRLETPTAGTITVDGTPVASRKDLSRRIQMIFQDPFSSFNPAHTIGYSLRRPLEIQFGLAWRDAGDRVVDMLQKVGLVPGADFLNKHANQLSGGQRQRANIARALLLSPEFIVADEPTSMLDVSVGIGILNLLLDLKGNEVSYLFITHNLAAARYIAERLVVLYKGQVVEEGPTDAIIQQPLHPYTRVLVAATPDLEKPASCDGLLEERAAPVEGCRFAPRCPFWRDDCEKDIQLKVVDERRKVRCVLY